MIYYSCYILCNMIGHIQEVIISSGVEGSFMEIVAHIVVVEFKF